MATIFELVDEDDAAAISELLAARPDTAAERDDQGHTPLFRALYRGRRGAFEAIRDSVPQSDPWERLVAGHAEGLPEPNARSHDGFTPLHLAAFAHNAPAARALLDAGADPDAVSSASFARVTPLGTCAFANEPEVARLLLEHGADPSLAEQEGGTPLEVARANGYDELAALLAAGG
jgi:ankyrin repeat protein